MIQKEIVIDVLLGLKFKGIFFDVETATKKRQ